MWIARPSWGRNNYFRNSAKVANQEASISKVENIEQEVQALTPAELAAFRRWFLEFDSQVWDRQIEEDV